MTVREYIELNIKYPGRVGLEFRNNHGEVFDVVELDWDRAHTMGRDLEFHEINTLNESEFNIVTIVESMDNIYY